MEKLVKEIKGINVPIANKLTPKLLIRFIIDDKLKKRVNTSTGFKPQPLGGT